MIDGDPIRITPDQRLAQRMNDAGKPFEQLLMNAKRANLEGAAVQALEATMFWTREKAYWDYARGEEATYFQTPYTMEVPGPDQGHIFQVAKRWAFELSGPKGKIKIPGLGTTLFPGFGTEIRSARFGTRLTSQIIMQPFYTSLRDNASVGDIYKIFGASKHQEITSSKDRRRRITVFEHDTNVGGTLYEVKKGNYGLLYVKRKQGRHTTSPARSLDGHAVRLVTSDELALDMAMTENPFRLMRLNAAKAGRADIVDRLDHIAFWESEKAYWMAVRNPRMRDHYDLNDILNAPPRYIYGVADGIARELSGSEAQYGKYHDLIRSDKYGSLLTRSRFQWGIQGTPDYSKNLPYDHPQIEERIQSIYTLLGATEAEKEDITSDEDRINGNTVCTFGTNLDLIGTEIRNRTTRDVKLFVKRV